MSRVKCLLQHTSFSQINNISHGIHCKVIWKTRIYSWFVISFISSLQTCSNLFHYNFELNTEHWSEDFVGMPCLGGQAEVPGLQLWICLSDCKDKMQLLKTVNNAAKQIHILHTAKTPIWLGFHLTIWSMRNICILHRKLWSLVSESVWHFTLCALYDLGIRKLINSVTLQLSQKERCSQKPNETQVFLHYISTESVPSAS